MKNSESQNSYSAILFSSTEYFAGAKFLSTHLFRGSVDDEKKYGLRRDS